MFRWKLTRGEDSGSSSADTYKPKLDHTVGDDKSYYAYVFSTQGQYEDSTQLRTHLHIGWY